MNFKLGKNAPIKPKFRLFNYLDYKSLPPPPPEADWTLAVSDDWGMDGNDQVGDCVYAGLAHAVMVVTANGDGIHTPTTAEVLAAYSKATGFDPKRPDQTDNGDTVTHGLQYMHDVGYGGHKVEAFAEIDMHDPAMVKQAVHLFQVASIGVALPKSAMESFGKGIWSDTSDSKILGGHFMPIFKYDSEGPTFITWGAPQKATWAWYIRYVDEAVATLFKDVVSSIGTSPDGVNMDQLLADVKALKV